MYVRVHFGYDQQEPVADLDKSCIQTEEVESKTSYPWPTRSRPNHWHSLLAPKVPSARQCLLKSAVSAMKDAAPVAPAAHDPRTCALCSASASLAERRNPQVYKFVPVSARDRQTFRGAAPLLSTCLQAPSGVELGVRSARFVFVAPTGTGPTPTECQ